MGSASGHWRHKSPSPPCCAAPCSNRHAVALSAPVNVLVLAGGEITLAQAIGGQCMAVNWFEGGRRIRDLLLWAVAIGGGVYVIWGNTPSVYFSTEYPDDPWQFTGEECRYPNESKYLWSYAFKPGDKRSVLLCYRANERERIPYRDAPTPKDAPPPVITVIPGADKATVSASKWYYEGESYDTAVVAYMNLRTAAFQMTPSLESAARDGLGKLTWNAGVQRFKEAFPWVGGLMAALWFITGVLGWIVRGFAGISAGADFRPAKRE